MTPKERIATIRLMERFHEHSEYLYRIGVDIEIRNRTNDHVNDHADD